MIVSKQQKALMDALFRLGEDDADDDQFLGTPLTATGAKIQRDNDWWHQQMMDASQKAVFIKGRQMAATQILRDELDQYVNDAMPQPIKITLTSDRISIEGNWKDMGLLTALKQVESVVKTRALWSPPCYVFPLTARHVIQSVFKGQRGVCWIGWNSAPEIDPNAAIELLVEYVGQCRSRESRQQRSVTCTQCNGRGYSGQHPNRGFVPWSNMCSACRGNGRVVTTQSQEAYANGWVDGGWNVRFPESVLRAYFGEPEKIFDGDFYSHLLASSNLNSEYKKLARRFHPDIRGGSAEQFRKLAAAYETLKDPMRRKRYEVGLKFASAAKKESEAVFKIPFNCGRVTVKGKWEETAPQWDGTYGSMSRNDIDARNPKGRRLNVTEIVRWEEIVREDGKVMVATWNHAASNKGARGIKPFTTTFEDRYQVEFDVTV